MVRLKAGPASLVADVTAVSGASGWVLVGRCVTGVERPRLGAVLAELHRADLATIVLPMGSADLRTMAGWIQIAATHIRLGLGDERPIAYLGAGRGAAAGWAAAVGGDLDGVMAWNALAEPAAWPYAGWASAPSLLVVDGASVRQLAARAAGWCFGGPVDVVDGSARDPRVLSTWYEDRLLARHASRRCRPITSAHRVRLASVAAAAAITLGPLSATAAAATLPDFSGGTRMGAAQIAGDRTSSTTATTRATALPGPHALHLKAGEIKGDGPRGDPPLIDGIGHEWFVNTNIGFATSSSASGAASEGSFTHAVAASTMGGGSVNAVLKDAFDGYNALCLDVNNVGGLCSRASMSVYNQNGPSSLECGGRQVVLPARTMGNFQVRRKVFVPTNDGFARWLNIVKNTTASTQTIRLVTSNNLGSDVGTRLVTTSDGDATPELTDTWATTFQNYSGTTSTDVRLGHVLRGLGAPVGLSAINFADGDDNPFWRYQFTLAPGQTAIIMNFATGQATKAAAAAQSASLADLSNPNAMACMTPAEIGQVLNFKTDFVAPACVWSRQPGPPKRVDFTVSDGVSGLKSIEITTANNVVVPVAVPAFTVGSNGAVSFSAVKANQSLGSQVAVVLTDVQGNTSSCI